MTYKVDGIYSNEHGYWRSTEWFVKQGEMRVIDGKIHYLCWSVWPTRGWFLFADIEKTPLFKKVKR